jgi:hypothetical protein
MPAPHPPIEDFARIILKGGEELLEVEDPFLAEMWASTALGIFYKMALPLSVRQEVESSIGPALVEGASRMGGAPGLAVLRALGAVVSDPWGASAVAAADALAAQGVPDPIWAGQIGRPELVDAWMTTDPYGDQRGYYATFRYPEHPPHTLTVLYDQNLGGIIKDAFAGFPKSDFRQYAKREPGVLASDADPGEMAARILDAVATGDKYLDNDWTDEFKKTRALLIARMRLLPAGQLEEPAPVERAERDGLIQEFLQSPYSTSSGEADLIADYCLDYRCDYGDGDPLRWSPTVVELFMLDHLPRKVTLDANQIRALPEVLRGWVRFALGKRGLEERWIEETETAVDRFAREFRSRVTDPSNFGPAKAIANAMRAAGVDLTDPRATQAWIDEFNSRPHEEREDLLGKFPFPS